MRNCGFICFILISHLFYGQGLDVQTRRDCHYDSMTVRSLIDTLSNDYNVGFSYDVSALPLDSLVNINLTQATIDEVVLSVLNHCDVEVSYYMGQMVISKRNAISNSPLLSHSVRISGTVLSKYSKEPVVMASVTILNKPIGTITNDSGRFDLIVQQQYLFDTISFSSVGFKRFEMVVPRSDTSIQVILKEEDIRLPEVVVCPINVNQILLSAVDNIALNYYQNAVSLTSFYRETVKENGQFVQISEAILEIIKPSYLQNSSLENVRFIKGRKRQDVDSALNISLRLQGGPSLFSRIDIARYLDFLPMKNIDNKYKYWFRDYSTFNGHEVMIIAFEPIVDEGDLAYKGELVVNTIDFAIVKVVFEMTNNALLQSRDYLIKKDHFNYRAKPYSAKYYVDYRPFNDKWILNSVRGELKLVVNDRKLKRKSNFVARTELLVSDLNPTEGKSAKFKDVYRESYVLYDKVSYDDAAFWDSYNIIRMDEDLNYLFDKK